MRRHSHRGLRYGASRAWLGANPFVLKALPHAYQVLGKQWRTTYPHIFETLKVRQSHILDDIPEPPDFWTLEDLLVIEVD